MTTSPKDYADWLSAAGVAPNTISQRTSFLTRVLREWGDLDQPPAVVAAWLAEYTGWTRRTYFNHLNSIYAWAVDNGQIDASPLARYRGAPSPRPRPRPLTNAELDRALDAAEDQRLRAWILLGAFAGLRAHEIAKVHGRDIDENSLFVRGKGGQEAVLPTHPILWALAQSYPRDGFWFPSRNRRREHVSASRVTVGIRDHFRAIGIDRGAAHRLRHTYGTSLARSGVQIRVVQELLRHRSLLTTQGYVEVSEPEKQAAIRKLEMPRRSDLPDAA